MWVSEEEIKNAKQYDLLTFLRAYNPQDLIKESRNSYCLKSHSSLKINADDSLWYRFSTNVGGRSAIDFLTKSEGLPFVDAVKTVNKYCSNVVLTSDDLTLNTKPADRKKTLGKISVDNEISQVRAYLNNRGISDKVITYCYEKGLLKQETKYKNAMFCGYDFEGNISYISMRGILNGSKYKGIVSGSDKQYCFRLIPAETEKINNLHIFEAAIDLLSYATILDMNGSDFRDYAMLSLDGVSDQYTQLPKSLEILLKRYICITNIVLHFDNDYVGKSAAKSLTKLLSKYSIVSVLPQFGKDVNDELGKILRS